MSDFVIRKDIYGSWWHDFNNDTTKINISDFEALIDEVQNTFIIQCKNPRCINLLLLLPTSRIE